MKYKNDAMKRLPLVLILPLIMFSCIKDDVIEIDNCLSGTEITYFDSCEELLVNFCEDVSIVQKFLPEFAKTGLSDFCYQVDDVVIFQDSEGNEIKFKVTNKALARRSGIFSNQDTVQQCYSYCLDSEFGVVYLDSDDINLYIQLVTKFKDDFKSASDVSKEVQTNLVVYETRPIGTNGTHHFLVLSIPYLNHIDEEIPIDTSKNIHHQVIELNGKTYQDVITSVYKIDTYIQVYYSFAEGFIGFKDSEDKIWTKQ